MSIASAGDDCGEVQRWNDGKFGLCDTPLVRNQFDWRSALGNGPVVKSDVINTDLVKEYDC